MLISYSQNRLKYDEMIWFCKQMRIVIVLLAKKHVNERRRWKRSKTHYNWLLFFFAMLIQLKCSNWIFNLSLAMINSKLYHWICCTKWLTSTNFFGRIRCLLSLHLTFHLTDKLSVFILFYFPTSQIFHLIFNRNTKLLWFGDFDFKKCLVY